MHINNTFLSITYNEILNKLLNWSSCGNILYFTGEKFREAFKSSLQGKLTTGRQLPSVATKTETQKMDVLLEPRRVRVLKNQHPVKEMWNNNNNNKCNNKHRPAMRHLSIHDCRNPTVKGNSEKIHMSCYKKQHHSPFVLRGIIVATFC